MGRGMHCVYIYERAFVNVALLLVYLVRTYTVINAVYVYVYNLSIREVL